MKTMVFMLMLLLRLVILAVGLVLGDSALSFWQRADHVLALVTALTSMATIGSVFAVAPLKRKKLERMDS